MKFFGKYFTFFALLLFFVVFQNVDLKANSAKNDNAFRAISLTTAKELATKEGKKIFLEFYASWCVPCKWMEETTLADERVQHYLGQKYISIKVDIDDFDGYAIKEHYQIKVLPTIMIVDEKGLTLVRKEQSLTAEMLLEILESKSGKAIEVPVNSSPYNLATANSKSEELEISNTSNHIENKEAIVKTTTYRVQVGVFTDYANTQKFVEKLNEMTGEPVVILNVQVNGKLAYKVLLGDFDNRQNAVELKNHLWKNYGIDSYVK